MLSKHLVENNLRGEMTFWDNASGVMDLKSQMEGEHGGEISNRQFEELLKKQGLTFSKTDIARFAFATERLSPLGRALPLLTARIVSDIQPRFNLFRRVFEKHEKLNVANLYTVLDPAMAAYGDRFSVAADSDDANASASSTNEPPPRFDVEELAELCHAAVAAHCGENVNWLKIVLDGLKINPNTDLERASSGAAEAIGGTSQGFMGDGKEEGESG